MKAMRWIIYSMLSVAFALSSCVDNDKDLSQPKEPEQTTDLIIPDGTDWTSTRSVNLSIISPVKAIVNVYTEEGGKDESLVATLPVSQEVTSITVDVAKSSKTIYIEYPTATGKSMLTAPLGAVTRADMTVTLPENVSGDEFEDMDEQTAMLIFYSPTKSRMGTLMFEDSWPDLGDYDFNDFVSWYHLTVRCPFGPEVIDAANAGITVRLQVRAMGGILPYRLGLQLDKMPAKYISEIIATQESDVLRLELQNKGESTPAVFILTGLDQLKATSASPKQYYNTENDYKVSQDELITIEYQIKVNTMNDVAAYLALKDSEISTTHNFFLQLKENGGREIHLRGYEPTHYYKARYEDDAVKGKEEMKNGLYYCSNDNFVWGLKVPDAIAHAREKIDFMKAYPKFRNWVTHPTNWEYENWFKIANTDQNQIISY